jgi:hypothetical protein
MATSRDDIIVHRITLTKEEMARAFKRASENVKKLVPWKDKKETNVSRTI